MAQRAKALNDLRFPFDRRQGRQLRIDVHPVQFACPPLQRDTSNEAIAPLLAQADVLNARGGLQDLKNGEPSLINGSFLPSARVHGPMDVKSSLQKNSAVRDNAISRSARDFDRELR